MAVSAVLVALTASSLVTCIEPRAALRQSKYVPLGAFLGSGPEGVEKVARFQEWLGAPVTVGHTYLPGDGWHGVEGPEEILRPWARWRRADPRRSLVLNVPMMAPNEARLPSPALPALLRAGAFGMFDAHYRILARRLVSLGAADTVIVLGWEMNGEAYGGRCSPDPAAWKGYWRRIVASMRGVAGAAFRFDFAPTRGRDTIPWTYCYPGDDVVDIIGSDSYDQPEGKTFQDYVNEPYGLQAQADFAAAHRKPISFPEWGLFRNSDNPEFIRGMHDWIAGHDVVYQTITDYCPHGVWLCGQNPRSSAAYRELFGGTTAPSPAPSADAPSADVPSPRPPNPANPATPSSAPNPAVTPPFTVPPPTAPGPLPARG
ncbi:glycosyl hydrolase family 26 [Actinomadura sp. NEAU-AAG5]|uniref:Glycosyl hydrolase family 26 n=1 Tax=Actinomadura litoris TaxID=2678616 RepID=A0A7K1KU76_9ACTN|nr:glycosyl hydrolase family 26 [Actinomadura litoris]